MPKLITHLFNRPYGGASGELETDLRIREPWNIAFVYTRQCSHDNPLHPAAFISAYLVDMALIDSGTSQAPLWLWAEDYHDD